MRKIAKPHDVLSHEVVRDLIAKAQQGDIKARNRVVEHNTSLIIRYANLFRYYKTCLDFDDLFQEGIFGLIRAVETFDIDSGYAFSTWAVLWIKQKVYRLISRFRSAVNIPYHIQDKVRRVKKKIDAGEQLSMKEQIMYLEFKNTETFSIDQEIADTTSTFHELLAAPLPTNQELIKHDLETLIAQVKVKERDREIYRLRSAGATMQVIGKRFTVSRQAINQTLKKVRKKIDRIPNK